MFRRIQLTLVSAALLVSSCGGCDAKKEVNREDQRLWGEDKIDQDFAEKAKETLTSLRRRQ